MTANPTAPTLNAQAREIVGKKVKALRREGLIPAVTYGHKKDSKNLVIDEREFVKLYNEVGQSTLINLKVDGANAVKVLIHGIDINPTKQSVLHVDLYQVNLKEKLQTGIPLEFIGVSPAVEDLGGTLLTIKDEVEVECLPDKLVQHIEVDISNIKTFDDSIRVSDLVAPEGIEILDDPEETIVSVSAPRTEEEMEELEAPLEGDATPEVESEHASGTDSEATEEGKEDGKKE